jgi:hypothetical protein
MFGKPELPTVVHASEDAHEMSLRVGAGTPEELCSDQLP